MTSQATTATTNNYFEQAVSKAARCSIDHDDCDNCPKLKRCRSSFLEVHSQSSLARFIQFLIKPTK
jgi:hypothetical protein